MIKLMVIDSQLEDVRNNIATFLTADEDFATCTIKNSIPRSITKDKINVCTNYLTDIESKIAAYKGKEVIKLFRLMVDVSYARGIPEGTVSNEGFKDVSYEMVWVPYRISEDNANCIADLIKHTKGYFARYE